MSFRWQEESQGVLFEFNYVRDFTEYSQWQWSVKSTVKKKKKNIM